MTNLVHYKYTPEGWERVCPIKPKGIQEAPMIVQYYATEKSFKIIKNRFDDCKAAFPSMMDIEVLYGTKLKNFWNNQKSLLTNQILPDRITK